jgi:hypothetical protein
LSCITIEDISLSLIVVVSLRCYRGLEKKKSRYFDLVETDGALPSPATIIINFLNDTIMNVLTLQITKDSFQAILKGEQDVEHRYVYPSNVARYVYFKHDGKKYKRQEDIPDDDKDVEVLPVEYDALYLINGRRKDAPRLTVEVKSAEFIIFTDEDGNDQVFEENGKEYLVCQVWYHLGKVLSAENI